MFGRPSSRHLNPANHNSRANVLCLVCVYRQMHITCYQLRAYCTHDEYRPRVYIILFGANLLLQKQRRAARRSQNAKPVGAANPRSACRGFRYYGIAGLDGDCAGLRPIATLSVSAEAAPLQSRPISGAGRRTRQLLSEMSRWIG